MHTSLPSEPPAGAPRAASDSELAASKAASRTVVLDLSGVTSVDAAGVAALEAARTVVEGAGRVFVLAGPAPHVVAAIRALVPCLLRNVRGARALHAVPDDGVGRDGTEPDGVDRDGVDRDGVDRDGADRDGADRDGADRDGADRDGADRDGPDCDALIRDHRDLADRLAARFAGRGQPLEDLRQVAYTGLVTAARRFDPARGVQFKTYAQATVAGELKRHFRDHAWQLHVARPVQELYLAVRTASEEMTHAAGRAPTPAELAARLGVTEEQVIESLEVRSALAVESLDAPREGDHRAPWREEAVLEDGYRAIEERSWLVPALRSLPERERRILKLRFFDGLPQSAIAAQVGISQMHVSRLLARTLETLRAAANE